MNDGSEDELLLATTGLREEVLGPWHQFVYEHGRHVSTLTGPVYVRYRPEAAAEGCVEQQSYFDSQLQKT